MSAMGYNPIIKGELMEGQTEQKKELGIYDTFYHQGKSITEWARELNNVFSPGELYRMAREGCDFPKFVLRQNNIITID